MFNEHEQFAENLADVTSLISSMTKTHFRPGSWLARRQKSTKAPSLRRKPRLSAWGRYP